MKLFEKACSLVPCQASRDKPDAYQIDPSLCRVDQAFLIFGQPSLPTQPRKGALDDPALGQDLEARCIACLGKHLRGVAFELSKGRIDHFQRAAVALGGPAMEFARVALIGPDPLQARKVLSGSGQDQASPLTILEISRVYNDGEQPALGIHEGVPLASGQFLGPSKPRTPPACVLTDWLSMIAALGVGSRPACRRANSRD